MKKIITTGILISIAVLLFVFYKDDSKVPVPHSDESPVQKKMNIITPGTPSPGTQLTKVKILDANEINQILSEDEKLGQLLKLEFPEGRLVKEEKLSSGETAKYIKSPQGEEVIQILSENVLTSEKWSRSDGTTLFKDYINSRLGSFGYKSADERWTYFFDSSMNISKKIFRRNNSTFCTKYDSQAPVSTSQDTCADDDFRELEDVVD